jgi:hypothetical protein
MAKALSRLIPNADCRLILVIRHRQAPKYATLMVQGMPLRVLNTKVQIDGRSYSVQAGERMDDFYEAAARFEWVLFIATPLLLIFAAAGGYWMSRRALNPVDESSRPGESHPQALTDPDMNVSAHPALIVQSAHDATAANEQTAVGLSTQSCKPTALLFVDVVSSVCISPSPSLPSTGPDSVMRDKVPICSSDHST